MIKKKSKRELTKEEQVFLWLISGDLSFTKLVSMYTNYLEAKDRDNSQQITDLAFIASMYRNPKMNTGTKETLEARFKKAIIKSGVFKGTKFEEELTPND